MADDLPNYTPGKADWSLIPEHMRGGLRLYIEEGIEPGSFLTAVLCNDLRGAVGKADHINIHRIVEWMQFLYNHAPAGCWGSKENYEAWIKHGGMRGEAP